MSATNQQHTPNNTFEPTTRALHQLSPNSQEAVIALVRQLAERESITIMSTSAPGLQTPTEGVPLWLAKLKAERMK